MSFNRWLQKLKMVVVCCQADESLGHFRYEWNQINTKRALEQQPQTLAGKLFSWGEQQREQDEIAQQAAQHGQTGQPTENDSRHKFADRQAYKTCDQGNGR